MAAISPRWLLKNEAAGWVSFFFALAALSFDASALAWQSQSDRLSGLSQEPRDRIERASQDQWQALVSHSAQAVLGETWKDDLGSMPPSDLPIQKRAEWLSNRIDQWTLSSAFVSRQTQAWITQRCGDALDRQEVWDFRLHDAWVRHQIAIEQPFLAFVQTQIAGDLLVDGPESRLGTAAWFRSPPTQQAATQQPSSLQPEGRWISRWDSPTLETLPDSLRWTSIRRLDWIHTEVAEPYRRRLLDLEAAMDSVLRAEQGDWQRLQRDETVIDAHRSRSSYPLPNPDELVFDLSAQPRIAEDETARDPHASYGFATPWKRTQPWSAILEFSVHAQGDTRATEPFVLVRQRSSCEGASPNSQTCTIEWVRGAIRAGLIHDLPYSYLAIETEPIFQEPGEYRIAIVYEGMPTARALRIWKDGKWIAVRVVHDSLLRDFASNDSQVLEVASQVKGAPCRVRQLECYRSALTSLELIGWQEESEWKDWESCSVEEQLEFREYYARRVDLQWRYQRESLLFYANSIASTLSKCGMLPVARSDAVLRLPTTMAEWVGEDSSREWSGAERRSLALRCGRELSEALANRETRRQWQELLASCGWQGTHHGEPDELGTIADRWRSTWDRRQLVAALLLSSAWTRIAIDSSP